MEELIIDDCDSVKNVVAWENIGQNLTTFDRLLQKRWTSAMEKGFFRYTLLECKHRTFDLMEDTVSSSKYPCAATLNIQRGSNRRSPDTFASMNAEFNNCKFNFNKIKNEEILFAINHKYKYYNQEDLIIINVSPIDYCHFLFVPNRNECLYQRLTSHTVVKAIEILLLSSQPGFRLSFNSLNAWASVNHLHFHGMYIDYPLLVDSIQKDDKLGNSCYLIDKLHVLPGFILEVNSSESKSSSIKCLADTTTKLTDLLHSMEIPYNLVLTRNAESDLRLVLWPRKSAKDLEKSKSFDIACVEVGGYFPFKSEESYNLFTPKMFRDSFNIAKLDPEIFELLVQKIRRKL